MLKSTILLLCLPSLGICQRFGQIPVPMQDLRLPTYTDGWKGDDCRANGLICFSSGGSFSSVPKFGTKLVRNFDASDGGSRLWVGGDGYTLNVATDGVTVFLNGPKVLFGEISIDQVLAEVMTQFAAFENATVSKELEHFNAVVAHETLIHKPKELKQDTDRDRQAALASAVRAWKTALVVQDLGIRPVLISGDRGSCSEDLDATACVVHGRQDIVLDGFDPTVDYRTIFMHEIGHLLGVPHIEGDPTMNPNYLGKMSVPSRAAVALARLYMRPTGSVQKR